MKNNFCITIVLFFVVILNSVAEFENQTPIFINVALGDRKPKLPSRPTRPELIRPEKDPNRAFLYSLTLPGSGQVYSNAKRGYAMIAAEIGLFVGYLLINRNAKSTREDYREQIRNFVVFDGCEGSNSFVFEYVEDRQEELIEIPCNFEAWDPIEDYEHATEFASWRNTYNADTKKIEESYASIGALERKQIIDQLQRLDRQQIATLERVGLWYWKDLENFKDQTLKQNPNSSQRQTAFDLRTKANDRFEQARTFIGFVILNHVVSAIDARIAAKHYNKNLAFRDLRFDFKTVISDEEIEGKFTIAKRF